MGAEQSALAKKAAKKNRVVLPTDVEVFEYDLTISTNLSGNFRFEGNVRLDVEVTKANVKEVTLHSKELQILEASFKTKGSEKDLRVTGLNYNIKSSTVTLVFDEALPEGEGFISIEFMGLHNDQMAGFYRSGYTDREGKSAVMVSTQFEPLDARRCFPCFDEPARKAVFRASLIVDDGLTALSNMPVESDTLLDDGKRRKFVFAKTPRMSTYLLAFCVGDFDFVEATSGNGVPIRAYTPPGKQEMGHFALDVAVKALDLYDDTFKEAYPLPKLDMIAIPEFAMGAMENWGLVTYREVDILVDSEHASSQQKQRVATVVCHELAHQWFGNLVTMAWWDGIWLNEAFASYTQAFAMATMYPEWSVWEQYIFSEMQGGLRLDALLSSHPIQVPVADADECMQNFDAISYLKGSTVVRMASAFLGKDAFEKGLQAYMARHKYTNTETSDLWNAWEEASGKPVAAIMSSWTEQMGFPVVTVRAMTWSPDESTCTLDLEQCWFISDGSHHKDMKTKLWQIPIFVRVGEGEVIDLGIMSKRTQKFEVSIPHSKRTWIKVNGDQKVPMRVNYGPVAEDSTPAFEEAIRSLEMPATDRAGLLLDTYALIKAGTVDPGELIKLLGAFENETSSPVFSAIEDILTGLHKLLQFSSELDSHLVALAKRIIAKPAADIGWDAKPSDGHLTRLLRASIIRLQALFMSDDPEIQEQAIDRFERYASDPEQNKDALPSDIKTAVIKIVLKSTSDPGYFNKCLELIDLADTDQAKKEIMFALGHAKSMDLKRRTLDWCTSGAVKKQDFFYAIGSVSSSSRQGLELTWDYLQENFDRIHEMIRTASSSLLAAAVTSSCGGFASNARAEEIETFFDEKSDRDLVPKISRTIEQIIENTRANAQFLEHIESSKDFEESIKAAGEA
ncbi:Aminopeptidase M1 [Hondaea fermentalgiana]|uniref:Aminopeptidase n=1 Tax=Hondaea fermentalgiana TaxID=2315210 RepID=A0A2R5G9X0_9STRA|nr:Aminopeptidase M1 [Hondaea fermentalgiana]|eukprot:GBG27365.1 Aminopeptidase M1 [Hondaea fermentalgiana]